MMTSLEDSGIGDTNTANDLKKMNLLEMSGDHTILEHVLMAKASASNSNTPDSLENNTNAEDEEVIDISMIQLSHIVHYTGTSFRLKTSSLPGKKNRSCIHLRKSHQKFDIILEYKVFKKLNFFKNLYNKKL